MIYNMLSIVWALSQSPLVMFFGLIAALLTSACSFVAACPA